MKKMKWKDSKMKVVIPKQEIEVKEGQEFQIQGVLKTASTRVSLVQAIDEPEVFIICKNFFSDGKKHWIENPETFVELGKELGFTWVDISPRIPLEDLNVFETGWTVKWDPTKQKFIEGEKARDIYFPSTPTPSMVEWVKGLMTLSGCPDRKTFDELGFNLIFPCKGSVAMPLGQSGVPMIVNGGGGAWSKTNEEKYRVVGYFMEDEPEIKHISPTQIIKMIDKCRSGTNLPITCVFTSYFWQVESEGWNRDWQNVIRKLDFASILGYFYQGGGNPDQSLVDGADEIVKKIQDIGKPVLGVAQAFEGENGRYTKPDFEFNRKFWTERNCGIVYYTWNAYDASIGSRLQDKWYNEQVKKANSK